MECAWKRQPTLFPLYSTMNVWLNHGILETLSSELLFNILEGKGPHCCPPPIQNSGVGDLPVLV